MGEFLKVVYMNYADNEKDGERYVCDKYIETFAPFMEKLRELLSDKLYEELDELFASCAFQNNNYYATQGMELAIKVMNKKYIPCM